MHTNLTPLAAAIAEMDADLAARGVPVDATAQRRSRAILAMVEELNPGAVERMAAELQINRVRAKLA
jgi:regulator of extracellular matrix RemA (YlzA/DUF370 family)